MYARVTEWDGVTPAEIDRDLAYARDEMIGKVEDIPGMSGILVLVDRGTGHSTSITLYDDEQSLVDSREPARILRGLMEQRMNLRRPPVVRELDVGIAMLNSSAVRLPSSA
jgi:hypothetical protein